MEVHQILPAISPHDAVSNNAIEIHKFLLKSGYPSKIFCKHIHPDLTRYVNDLTKYSGSHENVLFYHFSLAGGEVSNIVKNLPDKKILVYHNITPSSFFKNYDSELEYLCDQGIEELKSLNQIFDIAVGDSEYNVDCLKAYGYNKTDVVPIFLNFDINNQTYINKEIIYNIERKSINFLFVGRVAPNKKFEDVIITFFYYHKYINNNSNLYLVGNIQFPIYYNQLIDLVKRLNISKSVFFTGSVNNDELEKYYSIAHIFLCMSEHEGFCVPLLEAMKNNIPIVAYNSTAIPWTLGDSGILVNKKDHYFIAELINVLIQDVDFQQKVIRKQIERLSFFDNKITGKKILNIIEYLKNT